MNGAMLRVRAAVSIGAVFLASAAHGGQIALDCGANGELRSFALDGEPPQAQAVTPAQRDSSRASICSSFQQCYSRLATEVATNNLGGLGNVLETFEREHPRAVALARDPSAPPVSAGALRVAFDSCQTMRGRIADPPRPIDRRAIAIGYPFAGPNRQKISNRYDRERIERVARAALLNGNDPYLAIAILLMENTPVIASGQRQIDMDNYAFRYGDLPIDAVAAYNQLGCLASRSSERARQLTAHPIAAEYRDLGRQIDGVRQARDAVTEEIGRVPGLPRFFAQDETDLTALSSPECPQRIERLWQVARTAAEGFCGNRAILALAQRRGQIAQDYDRLRRGQRELLAGIPDETLRTEVSRALECGPECPGIVIRQRAPPTVQAMTDAGPTRSTVRCGGSDIRHGSPPFFTDRAEVDPALCCARVEFSSSSDGGPEAMMTALASNMVRDRVERQIPGDRNLSLSIQRFNGLGCIGCTERANQCLQNINAREQPIYGARAADLMINSVMASADIRAVMRDLLSEFNVPLRSSLCRFAGEGRRSLNREQYFNEQKRILGSRPACRSLFL